MSLHGTREAEVDFLLRTRRLVDLYKVVRESIRVSEPRYSIKNIEHFYLQGRKGGVKTAGASIVYYERWKETGDLNLLQQIEEYNFDDVRSTYELRQWLLTLHPSGLPWAKEKSGQEEEGAQEINNLTDHEKRLVDYRLKLIDPLPEEREIWGMEEHMKELTYQLLDFHRRASKPAWWAMFSRMEMTEEELFDDIDCLAGLELDPENPPRKVHRSVLYSYRFPDQDTKLKSGDPAVIIHNNIPVSDLSIDEENRIVRFKISLAKGTPATRINLGPAGPINTNILKEAIFRFADSLIHRSRKYLALEAILAQKLPNIRDLQPGKPIIPDSHETLSHIISATYGLDNSYLFIQGPPGTGKTFISSHLIVALMQQGYIIGVSSNSHKVINNLLNGIEKVARNIGLVFKGCKKSTAGNSDSVFNGEYIKSLNNNGEIIEAITNDHQLIAGTAWLFAHPTLDQSVDYLFIDEAGQVALANLVAIGTSAKNIVLVGDQMQLGQPIQGIHPGRSGESSLDYLLNGIATIPSDRGIFLKTTWRMHPDLCRFISIAVYDGRLLPEASNVNQKLILGFDAHPLLTTTGLRYIPVEHDSCSQKSDEEAKLVRELFNSLLKQRYRDRKKGVHQLTLNDILVVAPFNMQVTLLKQMLPEGARVGTVDKFQGQEAEVVIFSMATSNGEYLPRNIEFLYSKNRLNVAISRARCLALFISSPELMAIRCSKPDEMVLVNTLCWVKEVGSVN